MKLVKCAFLNEDHTPKLGGALYTYYAPEEVVKGDLVLAEVRGKEKKVMVIEDDVDPALYANVTYEIKQIKGLYLTEEDMDALSDRLDELLEEEGCK